MAEEFHGVANMTLHSVQTLPLWLAIIGIASAALIYLRYTDIPRKIVKSIKPIYILLENKYYFDCFNQWFFAKGSLLLGRGLWRIGDIGLIGRVSSKTARQN